MASRFPYFHRYVPTQWTRECSELVLQARAARRKWTTIGREEDWVTYQATANNKKRQIRRDRIKAWRKTVAEITSNPGAI